MISSGVSVLSMGPCELGRIQRPVQQPGSSLTAPPPHASNGTSDLAELSVCNDPVMGLG